MTSEGSFFRRLHGLALRVQVPLILAAVPAAAALYGFAVAPIVVDTAVDGSSSEVRRAAREVMWLVVVLLVGCVGVATAGAALLLRGSVRSVVERVQHATDAIARGEFRHRVDSRRTDELGRLAASIDAMAERLERLEEARRRMLACVSHELRTPLTIIRGSAYTLSRHEEQPLRRERLQLVQDEASRLAELIEDLVDASSLHAGSVRLRIERRDLVELVEGTIERFAEEAEMRGVRLVSAGPRRVVSVAVDPARLEQLLANLVGNALRHADEGSAVRVQVDAPRAGGTRHVTVSNRGPSIPPELARDVFEPFVQGEQRSGRVGLGLAIAHGLASAHGGELSLLSRGGAGDDVAFRLALPSPTRAPFATARTTSQPALRPLRRVLAVEP